MELVQHLRSAWKNDSFYMKATTKNAANIFKAGIIGCLAGRIIGVISPRDGAIYSIANEVSDIFINWIEEHTFTEEPFMSDKDIEEILRWSIKITLTRYLGKNICSLAKVKSLELFGFNKVAMGFICITVVIDAVTKMAFAALFPFLKPSEAP